MKKIIIFVLCFLSIIFYFNYTYAEWTWSTKWIKIVVTEKIPWANCSPVKNKKWEVVKDSSWYVAKYECEIKKWFGSVVQMMWSIIKYFTYTALLSAVLLLVVGWIMYSMAWADPSAKDKAKEKVIWAIIWIIVLLLSWVILNILAPWIYK